MKKIIGAIALVAVIGILVFGAVNRSMAKISSEGNSSNESEGKLSIIDYNDGLSVQEETIVSNTEFQGELVNLLPPSSIELSDVEAAGLLFMLEEEKLAHDVYAYFYDHYGTRNFQNISQSEETHMAAVKVLIDRYGLSDPTSTVPGVFTDPSLQGLYDQLIATGSQSVGEALKVGAAIEEIDILDLQERMAQTDKADIMQVYQSLLDGSENHLRAFAAKIYKETGENYVPQYLTQDAYQLIINSDFQGNGTNQGGNGYNQDGNGNNGGNGNGRP